MPVRICWSEKERRSLRQMGDEEGGLRDMFERMRVEERRRQVKFVIMKERRTWVDVRTRDKRGREKDEM